MIVSIIITTTMMIIILMHIMNYTLHSCRLKSTYLLCIFGEGHLSVGKVVVVVVVAKHIS